MSEQVIVNYAAAEAWKKRAESAAVASRLAQQAVKAALVSVKAGNPLHLVQKLRREKRRSVPAGKLKESGRNQLGP